MKLLLDQGLPRSTPTWLKQAGIDAIHVAEIGLATATDANILQGDESLGTGTRTRCRNHGGTKPLSYPLLTLGKFASGDSYTLVLTLTT
jgi:hypothetical protein